MNGTITTLSLMSTHFSKSILLHRSGAARNVKGVRVKIAEQPVGSISVDTYTYITPIFGALSRHHAKLNSIQRQTTLQVGNLLNSTKTQRPEQKLFVPTVSYNVNRSTEVF